MENYRRHLKVDRQGGQSLFFGSKMIRPNYQLKNTQVIKELVSITAVSFNRTGSREGKKDFFIQGSALKTLERITKETDIEFLERAKTPGAWLLLKYKTKQIPHYDF